MNTDKHRLGNRLISLLWLPGLLLLCGVGMFAALIGWRGLDDWCARQLTDGDLETK